MWSENLKIDDLVARECAEGLRVLAADGRFQTRQAHLADLAADLESPEGDSWAGVDLFAAFPASSTVSLRHRTALERWLGVLAGASVFLPVGWTWWGFREASKAFERLIAADGEPEGRTFLGMWASGFDGRLDGVHRLVPMAGWSLILILLAVMCLVAHRLVAARNERKEDKREQAAEDELVKLLTTAQIILNARRADHPLRIEGIVKSSLKKLREAHISAREVIAELATTAVGVGAGVSELLESVHRARSEAEGLLTAARASTEDLSSAVARTQQAVAEAVASLNDAVTSSVSATREAVVTSVTATQQVVTAGVSATQNAVTESTARLVEAVDRTVGSAETSMSAAAGQVQVGLDTSLARFERSLTTAVDSLKSDSISAIGGAGASLMTVVDQIGSGADVSAGAAQRLTEQVERMNADQVQIREDFVHAIGDVREALVAIEDVLDRHASTLQGQASELTATRDAAERLLQHLTASLAGAGA